MAEWLSLKADHGGICTVLTASVVAVVERSGVTEMLLSGGNSVFVQNPMADVLGMLGAQAAAPPAPAETPSASAV